MKQRSKFSLKAKILSLIVAVGLIFGGLVYNPFLEKDNTPKSVEASASDYGLASNIQDGVILHCFDWKYNDIISCRNCLQCRTVFFSICHRGDSFTLFKD